MKLDLSFEKDTTRPSTYVKDGSSPYFDVLYVPVNVWKGNDRESQIQLYVSETAFDEANGYRGCSPLLAIRTLLKGAYELAETDSETDAKLTIHGHRGETYHFRKVRESPPYRCTGTTRHHKPYNPK